MPNNLVDLSLNYPVPASPHWNIIDATKVKTFMRCPRLYFYQYVLGWKSARPNLNLIYGEAVHAALEHLFEHGHTEDQLLPAYNKFLEIYRADFDSSLDSDNAPKDPTNFMQVLSRYLLDNQRFNTTETIYIEGRENRTAGIVGTVPINETTEMHFKMDAIVRDPGGRIMAIEHKTAWAGAFSGKNKDSWCKQWQTSTQVATYLHALYCMFDAAEVDGVLINGISPAKGENKFVQVRVTKTYAMLNAWLADVNYWVDLLAHNFRLLAEATPDDTYMSAFPRNDQACGDFGGCPMIDFCSCWPNPIARSDTPPVGWTIEHWDPRTKAKSEKDIISLRMKGLNV